MFDTLSLKYFGVIAREGSVNRAARLLHASQPAVSRRVKQLEHEVGAHLFKRSSTGVALTPAGHALVRYAEEIRRLADEARHVVRQVSGRPGKLVRIGFYQPAVAVLLPLLRLLQMEHPGIAVEPIEASRAALLESLRRSEIDLALPGFVPPGLLLEFDGLRVPGPAWNFVLPDGHRYCGRKRLHLAELKDEEFISLDEREFPGFNILLHEQCRLAGFMPKISVYAHTWSEAVAYVVAGRGIAIALRSAIVIPLAATLTLVNADVNPEWYALWNTSNGNPHLRNVIQLLLDAPPPGWSSIKRMLPPLGFSRILPPAQETAAAGNR